MEDQKKGPNIPPKPEKIAQAPESKVPLSDDESAALLTINRLQTSKPKGSKKSLILVGVIVLMLLAISFFIDSRKPAATKTNQTTNLSLPSSKQNPLNGSSTTAQAQYCSNVINANLNC